MSRSWRSTERRVCTGRASGTIEGDGDGLDRGRQSGGDQGWPRIRRAGSADEGITPPRGRPSGLSARQASLGLGAAASDGTAIKPPTPEHTTIPISACADEREGPKVPVPLNCRLLVHNQSSLLQCMRATGPRSPRRHAAGEVKDGSVALATRQSRPRSQNSTFMVWNRFTRRKSS